MLMWSVEIAQTQYPNESMKAGDEAIGGFEEASHAESRMDDSLCLMS